MNKYTNSTVAGFSFVEMIIAITMVVVLLSSMASALISAKNMATSDTLNIHIQSVAKITLDRIARELSKSGESGSNQPQIYDAGGSITTNGPAIRFQRRIVNSSGDIDWSTPFQIKRFDSSVPKFTDKVVFWEDNSPDSLTTPGSEDRCVILAHRTTALTFEKILGQIVITIRVEGSIPNRTTTFASELSTNVAVPEY